jgi:hypothetical protein
MELASARSSSTSTPSRGCPARYTSIGRRSTDSIDGPSERLDTSSLTTLLSNRPRTGGLDPWKRPGSGDCSDRSRAARRRLVESAELTAARKRIRELETELAVTKRANVLKAPVRPTKALGVCKRSHPSSAPVEVRSHHSRTPAHNPVQPIGSPARIGPSVTRDSPVRDLPQNVRPCGAHRHPEVHRSDGVQELVNRSKRCRAPWRVMPSCAPITPHEAPSRLPQPW